MKSILRILLLFVCLSFSSQIIAQSNQYLHFDRVDDHVLMENGSSYIAGSDAFSMTGWFWTDEIAYGQGMVGLRGADQGFYLIQLDNGIIECRFQNSNGTLYEYVTPSFTIVPQTWQHFAWVYTGSAVELYLDGDLIGSANATGTFNNETIPFAIGRSILANLDFYYGGRIDEVTLWSKALNEDDLQAMMSNELDGDEANLEAYFKFNQGVPEGDNTSIQSLDNEVGDGDRPGELINFALTGADSNFGGEFDASFQAISFPLIPHKLISAEPFEIAAEASSALPVEFEIDSGPASISGNTITLDGTAGTVRVVASQAGNAVFDPAEPITVEFDVLDPQTTTPAVDPRAPYDGAVVMSPGLNAIRLVAQSSIGYPDLFSVSNVDFVIEGETIPAMDWGDGFYSAWYTPVAGGDQTLEIHSYNNYGAANVRTVDFNIAQLAGSESVNVMDGIWMTTSTPVVEVEVDLPVQVGAHDHILANLELTCPPTGGCGEWDRIANIEAQNYNGEWINIIRYITPYGTACSHQIDLTDYASVLYGKTKFRLSYGTFDNGYEFHLDLDYEFGTPEFTYSEVVPVWQDIYPFGDMADLQPVPSRNQQILPNTQAAKLKLLATGHGWGDNNTGNAAEFHEDTHNIWVNGSSRFEHNNWYTCNPHPDDCSPQAGTWTFARAGWCPGAISQFFEYDMTEYTTGETVELQYRFDEDYVDLCHDSNPDCVSGVTCPDCSDGFNPELHVSSHMIFYGNNPPMLSTAIENSLDVELSVYPNPAKDQINLIIGDRLDKATITIVNALGQEVQTRTAQNYDAGQVSFDVSKQSSGVYMLVVRTDKGFVNKQFVIQ